MRLQDKLFVTIGSVVILAAASYTGYALFLTKDSDVTKASITTMTSSASSATVPTTSQQTSSAASATTSYKDGTYAKTANYRVPHGAANSLSVSLTVTNGVVASVNVSNDYQDGESADYVDMFTQEIKSTVVGKSLAGLSVSRVGGASLTSDAFNNALDTIRDDARA